MNHSLTKIYLNKAIKKITKLLEQKKQVPDKLKQEYTELSIALYADGLAEQIEKKEPIIIDWNSGTGVVSAPTETDRMSERVAVDSPLRKIEVR